MPQEYTVKQWKPWENEEGLIRDAHGNYKGTVIFDEDSAEPIDATFKTQPSPGDKKYGTVSQYETKAGKLRVGFKSAPKPQDGAQASFGTAKKEWQPRDDNAIRAQWAIGQAVQASQKKWPDAGYYSEVQELASNFFQMVDRVKDSSPKAEAPTLTKSVEEEQAQRQAERDAEALHAVATEDKVYMSDDEPINLSDIPF